MISSLFKMKCPRCHKGDLFQNPNLYNLSTIDKMPHSCPHCGLLFSPAPGFYFGAMYISYGIGILLFFTAFLLMEIILKISDYIFLAFYITSLFILWPVVFRYARVIYIYILVRFDSKAEARFRMRNSLKA